MVVVQAVSAVIAVVVVVVVDVVQNTTTVVVGRFDRGHLEVASASDSLQYCHYYIAHYTPDRPSKAAKLLLCQSLCCIVNGHYDSLLLKKTQPLNNTRLYHF